MSGRILILDDVATDRILMKVRLEAGFYDATAVADVAAALRLARTAPPDLIIARLSRTDAAHPGTIQRLRSDPALRETPIIAMGCGADMGQRVQALRAGADDCIDPDLPDTLLLARVRKLLRGGGEAEAMMHSADTPLREGFAETAGGYLTPTRIAILADDLAGGQALRRILQPHLPQQHITILARDRVLADPDATDLADLYLIPALGRPTADRLHLISELQARAATRHAAIAGLFAPDDREAMAVALDLGAGDVMPTDVLPEEMALRLSRQIVQKRRSDTLRRGVEAELRLAVTDPLTGLYNRRHALPQLRRIADEARRKGRSFAVLLADIDRFKAVNDTHGHVAGDRVLGEVAARLKAAMRDGDLLARIGGEEFLVVLPDTGFDQALEIAERLRAAVAEVPVRLSRSDRSLHITLSVGLAMGGGARAAAPVDDLVNLADQALLSCKATGRNRVTAHQTTG